jgi:hypothetical protein
VLCYDFLRRRLLPAHILRGNFLIDEMRWLEGKKEQDLIFG